VGAVDKAKVPTDPPGPTVMTIAGVRKRFLQLFEQQKKVYYQKVYCTRHRSHFFPEHQITEDGVQDFSLKTVTLQNLEQFLKLVNFMGIVQKCDGCDFEQFCRGVQKIVQLSMRG
jgi:hypothetical protein